MVKYRAPGEQGGRRGGRGMKQERGKGKVWEGAWGGKVRCKIKASFQSLSLFYDHLLSLTRSACGFLFKPTDYKSGHGFKILVRLCLTVIV